MFYIKFIDRCNLYGYKPSNVLEHLGLSSGNLVRWRNGGVPSVDVLVRIADYLDTTTDYLLSRETKPTLPDPTAQIIKIGQGGELVMFDIPPKQVPLAKKLLEVLAEDDV